MSIVPFIGVAFIVPPLAASMIAIVAFVIGLRKGRGGQRETELDSGFETFQG